jgi:hypothetical protein
MGEMERRQRDFIGAGRHRIRQGVKRMEEREESAVRASSQARILAGGEG